MVWGEVLLFWRCQAALLCINFLISEKTGGKSSHKHIKNPGPEDQALAIPRGDLLCWQLINLLKSQTSNYKLQTISNDQNSKIQTMSCPEKFWSLNIVI